MPNILQQTKQKLRFRKFAQILTVSILGVVLVFAGIWNLLTRSVAIGECIGFIWNGKCIGRVGIDSIEIALQDQPAQKSFRIVDESGKILIDNKDIISFNPASLDFQITWDSYQKAFDRNLTVILDDEKIFSAGWWPEIYSAVPPGIFVSKSPDGGQSKVRDNKIWLSMHFLDFSQNGSANINIQGYRKNELKIIEHFWQQDKLSETWQVTCKLECNEGNRISIGYDINTTQEINSLFTPTSQGEGFWISQDSADPLKAGFGYEATTSLSIPEIIQAEVLLKKSRQLCGMNSYLGCVANKEADTKEGIDINNYFRQYMGFVDQNGHKIVYINMLSLDFVNQLGDYAAYDLSEPLIFMDGGRSFIDVEINLTDKKVTRFAPHGEA